MPYVSIALGAACLLLVWQLYPAYPVISNLLVLTGILGFMPARLKSFPRILSRTCAALGTVLAFLLLGMFFTLTPTMASNWYLAPIASPYLALLIGGLTNLIVVSENSCCLKAGQTEAEVPNLINMVTNLRRRIQEIRPT